MISTQSRTFAKSDTSPSGLPFASANGTVCTAALILDVGGSVVRSSCRNERKLALSSGETSFPSRPSCAGYSQSMSMPSRSNSRYSARMFAASVCLLSASETAGEKYLGAHRYQPQSEVRCLERTHLLPVQPPTLSLTFLPLRCAAETRRESRPGAELGSSQVRL